MIERNGSSKITIKVVSPKWIVDCVEKKVLLSEAPYTILPTTSSNPTLNLFFKSNKSSSNITGQKRQSTQNKNIPKPKKQKLTHSQPVHSAYKEVEDLTSKLYHSQYSNVLSQVPNAQKKTKKYK